jgi:2-octaprenyl-6-methoxyphenol hydroxylase
VSRPFDIVIVGGGMVGASLAAALAPLPISIAVVEAWPPSSDAQPSYDDRCTAVAEGSRRIFEGIGCWRAIEASATPISRIHVSDRGRFGFVRLDRRDYGVQALGYVVENRQLGKALWEMLSGCDNVALMSPARVDSVQPGVGQIKVSIAKDGQDTTGLTASLLVAADGARSAVRTMLELGEQTREYGQSALIANVSPSEPHRNEAYERFTETGPLALLPMSGNRCSLVWTLPPEVAAEFAQAEETDFLRRLQDAFGFRLGRFTRAGARASYPLKLIRAERQSAPRVLLIGNAAHSVHPVAGQGFNLGLRDVAALADVVADAVVGGVDPGVSRVLDAYRDWRSDDQQTVARLTDSLVRLFTNPLAPVKAIRGLGLMGLDIAPGPKSVFAHQAMGLRGRLPRLARGLPLS